MALEKVNKKIGLGAYPAPFTSIPYHNPKCTPLALTEKPPSSEYQLLHNISYPYNKFSVNLCIPVDQNSLKYASLRDAIVVLKIHPVALMAKAHIKNAFRSIPIAPEDYMPSGFL